MKDIQEKKYCKKIINEAVREAFNEIMFEETKPKKKTTTINESDALVILENLENGIRNVQMLDEAKKKKKSKKKKSQSKKDSKSKSSKKGEGKKEKKEKDSKNLKVLKKQVLSMLNQEKFDMAAVAREVYPTMDDDARRSYVSRQSRGLENIANDKVTDYYHALRSASKGRKGGQV